MAWNDDSWKDGYDAWKLASPEDYEPEEECFHEDYESSWEGRATCDRCGHSWWLSSTEMEWDRQASEAFDAYCRREERREKIAEWVNWLTFWRRWRGRKPAMVDDECPF